eukprot:1608735-Rhodomonas_salina.2
MSRPQCLIRAICCTHMRRNKYCPTAHTRSATPTVPITGQVSPRSVPMRLRWSRKGSTVLCPNTHARKGSKEAWSGWKEDRGDGLASAQHSHFDHVFPARAAVSQPRH